MNKVKIVPPYVHVLHATETDRRAKYHGCVSRQTLRAQLRKDAVKDIRFRYPGEEHSVVRSMAFAKASRDYRSMFNLPEPR